MLELKQFITPNNKIIKNINVQLIPGKNYTIETLNYVEKLYYVQKLSFNNLKNDDEINLNGTSVLQFSPLNLKMLKKSICICSSKSMLIEEFNVYENITLPGVINSWPKDKIKKRLDYINDIIPIENIYKKQLNSLTSNEIVKVKFIQNIFCDPKILIVMDQIRLSSSIDIFYLEKYMKEFLKGNGCIIDFSNNNKNYSNKIVISEEAVFCE